MRFRWYREWRADLHMRGNTANSPFISVVQKPEKLAASSDPWASTIVTGNPGLSGVLQAPDLGEFNVPSSRLLYPKVGNLLSIEETELVFWGDDLANFLVKWDSNPYY